MRTLTPSEKRTITYGGIALGAILCLFGGMKIWGALQKDSATYVQLVADSKDLRQKLGYYDDRILLTKKMMDEFHLDPAKLTHATVVGEASQKIQQTAASGGIQVGPIRETAAKSSAKELAALQFEGSGPIPAVLGLLKRMETLGYPLVVDSVDITPNPMRPDQINIHMTVVILDFDQWKTEGKPHA
jgi:hypothetical protein